MPVYRGTVIVTSITVFFFWWRCTKHTHYHTQRPQRREILWDAVSTPLLTADRSLQGMYYTRRMYLICVSKAACLIAPYNCSWKVSTAFFLRNCKHRVEWDRNFFFIFFSFFFRSDNMKCCLEYMLSSLHIHKQYVQRSCLLHFFSLITVRYVQLVQKQMRRFVICKYPPKNKAVILSHKVRYFRYMNYLFMVQSLPHAVGRISTFNLSSRL